jgi:ABC-type polysaccharide/polyol phosphate transport system ATPase subunit
MQTMTDLLANAGTIVFVSHTLSSVEEFCDRTMWLDGGKIRSLGESSAVVEEYRAESARRRALKSV